MAVDRWQMGLIYTRLQTLVTLCVREWTKSVCTESAMRSTDFLRRGQLWRRRALGCECGGGETTVMLRTDRAINFLVKVFTFSEQQPRQKATDSCFCLSCICNANCVGPMKFENVVSC
jgi:hypothetical protein